MRNHALKAKEFFKQKKKKIPQGNMGFQEEIKSKRNSKYVGKDK